MTSFVFADDLVHSWYVMKFSSSHLPALSSEGMNQLHDVRSQQLDFEMTWPKYTFVILKWARGKRRQSYGLSTKLMKYLL